VPTFEDLVESLKKSAAILRESGVPFALGGGLAVWARGGPENDHDLDLMVKPEDAERALETLEEAGLRTERPPEDWLLKAYDGPVLIDLIFRPASGEVDDEMLNRAELLEVSATQMCVLSLEDVIVTKLLALNATHLDYKAVLELARSVREQIDWDAVRERTKHSPYAQAFFTLVEELGVLERSSLGEIDS
jgi:predicted nucleotidyltransferase